MDIRNLLFAIFLALVGVTVGVVAPLLRKKYQKILASAASALLIACTCFWVGYEIGNKGAAGSRLPDTAARITSHRSGGEIDQQGNEIQGTFDKLQDGQKLWLYVLSSDRYFLHEVTTFSNGTWKVEDVTVGADGETGVEFKIGILVADLQADKLISRNPDGVYYLPSGATVLEEIAVIRR